MAGQEAPSDVVAGGAGEIDVEGECLIWSNEHGRWWGPASWGYVPDVAEAGVYSRKKAVEIASRATIGQWNVVKFEVPNELVVRVVDLPMDALLRMRRARDVYAARVARLAIEWREH